MKPMKIVSTSCSASLASCRGHYESGRGQFEPESGPSVATLLDKSQRSLLILNIISIITPKRCYITVLSVKLTLYGALGN